MNKLLKLLGREGEVSGFAFLYVRVIINNKIVQSKEKVFKFVYRIIHFIFTEETKLRQ